MMISLIISLVYYHQCHRHLFNSDKWTYHLKIEVAHFMPSLYQHYHLTFLMLFIESLFFTFSFRFIFSFIFILYKLFFEGKRNKNVRLNIGKWSCHAVCDSEIIFILIHLLCIIHRLISGRSVLLKMKPPWRNDYWVLSFVNLYSQ
jgi:hypothetical protein